MDRNAIRQSGRLTDRQIDRQTYIQIDGRTDGRPSWADKERQITHLTRTATTFLHLRIPAQTCDELSLKADSGN